MKVYGSREFQGLKVGVLSKESLSFLSPSKNWAEKHEKGWFWLLERLVKDFNFSRSKEEGEFSRNEEGGMRKENSLRAEKAGRKVSLIKNVIRMARSLREISSIGIYHV